MKKVVTQCLFAILMVSSLPSYGKKQDATSWQVQAGSAVLAADLPWKGIDNQVTAVPFVQAVYGNWTFGMDMLAKYDFKLARKSGLGGFAGLSVRDNAYKSNVSLFQDKSTDKVFEGYNTPDTEWVAVAGLNWLWFAFSVEQDISGHSESQSYQFSIDLPLYRNDRGLMLKANLRAHFLSEDYVNYYYGINQKQENEQVGRKFYDPASASNYSVSVNLIYPFYQQWALVAEARHSLLDKSVHDSPLVENDTMNNLVFTVTYQF